MKKIIVIFMMCFIVAFVSGCNQEIVTQVNLKELVSMKPGDQTTVRSIILYELPSEQEFKKTLPFMKELFSNYCTVNNISMEKRGFRTFGMVDIQTPVLTDQQTLPFQSLFYFVVENNKISASFEHNSLQSFKGEIADVYSNLGNVSLKTLAFQIYLTNDTGKNINLTHRSQFIDGVATAFNYERTMDAGESYLIELSNVYVVEMEMYSQPFLIWQ